MEGNTLSIWQLPLCVDEIELGIEWEIMGPPFPLWVMFDVFCNPPPEIERDWGEEEGDKERERQREGERNKEREKGWGWGQRERMKEVLKQNLYGRSLSTSYITTSYCSVFLTFIKTHLKINKLFEQNSKYIRCMFYKSLQVKEQQN